MAEMARLDWQQILEDIRVRLQQALEAVDDRAAAAGLEASGVSAERTREWDELGAQLQQIPAQVERVERLTGAADHILQTAAEPLQVHVEACSRLRSRLADWVGRAIG